MYHHVPYKVFLHWVLLISLVVFATALLFDLGVLSNILTQDITRLTAVILLLFFATSCHAGYRAWLLSTEFNQLDRWQTEQPARAGRFNLVGSYLLLSPHDASDSALTAEVFAEKLRGPHQPGWFITGVLVKLGLLGTVVGFILMLNSVHGLENLDTSDIKELMQQMTEGMGIAMNTTLVGLVSSILLGTQYLLLDRAADQLVTHTLELGELQQATRADQALTDLESELD
ncbi:MAG: MotA/TolQ/ExbB proton channel family protein [Oceanobacter sp.]